jgi:hypothetical protein
LDSEVKVAQSEIDQEAAFISQAIERKDMITLVGHVALSLTRIAIAQEKVVALAEADIQATVDEEVEARAQVKAVEIAEDKAKRSYIGRK